MEKYNRDAYIFENIINLLSDKDRGEKWWTEHIPITFDHFYASDREFIPSIYFKIPLPNGLHLEGMLNAHCSFSYHSMDEPALNARKGDRDEIVKDWVNILTLFISTPYGKIECSDSFLSEWIEKNTEIRRC